MWVFAFFLQKCLYHVYKNRTNPDKTSFTSTKVKLRLEFTYSQISTSCNAIHSDSSSVLSTVSVQFQYRLGWFVSTDIEAQKTGDIKILISMRLWSRVLTFIVLSDNIFMVLLMIRLKSIDYLLLFPWLWTWACQFQM